MNPEDVVDHLAYVLNLIYHLEAEFPQSWFSRPCFLLPSCAVDNSRHDVCTIAFAFAMRPFFDWCMLQVLDVHHGANFTK